MWKEHNSNALVHIHHYIKRCLTDPSQKFQLLRSSEDILNQENQISSDLGLCWLWSSSQFSFGSFVLDVLGLFLTWAVFFLTERKKCQEIGLQRWAQTRLVVHGIQAKNDIFTKLGFPIAISSWPQNASFCFCYYHAAVD